MKRLSFFLTILFFSSLIACNQNASSDKEPDTITQIELTEQADNDVSSVAEVSDQQRKKAIEEQKKQLERE